MRARKYSEAIISMDNSNDSVRGWRSPGTYGRLGNLLANRGMQIHFLV